MKSRIDVDINGRGDYTSIGEALNVISLEHTEPVTIFVHEGIYREKLAVNRPYTTIMEDGADKTVLTYGDYARMLMPDNKRGTFRTQTLLVYIRDFKALAELCQDRVPGVQAWSSYQNRRLG